MKEPRTELSDSDIEWLLKTYYPKIRKEIVGKPKGPCPTEEDFACFIDDVLTGEDLKRFTDHVITCDACAEALKDLLAITRALETEPLLEVPPHVTEKAKALICDLMRKNEQLRFESAQRQIQVESSRKDVN